MMAPDLRFLLSKCLFKFLKSKDISLGIFILRSQRNNPSSPVVGSTGEGILLFKGVEGGEASISGANVQDSFGDTLQSAINKVLKHVQMSRF